MSTQTNITSNLLANFPEGWTPVNAIANPPSGGLWCLFTSIAGSLGFLADELGQPTTPNTSTAKTELRIKTADGYILDAIAMDFFGGSLKRASGESDVSFRSRILVNVLGFGSTQSTITNALTALTGTAPKVITPGTLTSSTQGSYAIATGVQTTGFLSYAVTLVGSPDFYSGVSSIDGQTYNTNTPTSPSQYSGGLLNANQTAIPVTGYATKGLGNVFIDTTYPVTSTSSGNFTYGYGNVSNSLIMGNIFTGYTNIGQYYYTQNNTDSGYSTTGYFAGLPQVTTTNNLKSLAQQVYDTINNFRPMGTLVWVRLLSKQALLSELNPPLNTNIPSYNYYLIPDTTATLIHANAYEIVSLRSRAGGVWSVPGGGYTLNYNSSLNPIPSLGTNWNSTSNYWALTHHTNPNPTPPFIVVVLANCVPNGGYQTVFNYGVNGVSGLQLDWNNTFEVIANSSTTQSTNTAIGGLNVMMCGFTGTTQYVKLNAGPIASTAVTWVTPAVNVTLAAGGGTTPPTQSKIYEVFVSNDAPSAQTFQNIYNQVQSSLAGGQSQYLLTSTANTTQHLNAADFIAGTAITGTNTWTPSGAVPFNPYPVAGPVASWGPTAANLYYKTTTANLPPITSPFTIAIAYQQLPKQNQQRRLFFNYTSGTTGITLLAQANVDSLTFSNGSVSITAPTVPTITSVQPHLVLFGYDGTNMWLQVDGGPAQTAAATLTSPVGTNTVELGYGTGALAGASWYISEFLSSTDTPSTTLFTNFYNQFVANNGFGSSSLVNVSNQYLTSSPNAVTRVNASDLALGTAAVGGAWTGYNFPTLTRYDAPRGSITYGASIYSGQAITSPANIGPPITLVAVFKPSALTTSYLLDNNNSATGYSLYFYSTGCAVIFGSNIPPVTTSAPILNGFNVLIAGMDASGNVFIQLNGGAVNTVAKTVFAPSTTSTIFIGAYASSITTYPFAGSVYEIQVSTDVPSAAAFNAIYNSIITNL